MSGSYVVFTATRWALRACGQRVAETVGSGATRPYATTRARQRARAASSPALAADVTNGAPVDGAVARMVERWRRLDILVNNAGITGRSFPIWELSDEDWRQVLDADLTSVFLCCRAAVTVMLAQRSGRIVNIASIAGNPTPAPYSSAKAGVIGLTKALAKEVATHGILVNAVAPAVIGTDLLKQMEQSAVDMLVQKIPMGWVGTPEEVAALVAWLASDECSFSTGAVRPLRGPRHVLSRDRAGVVPRRDS